MKTYPRAYFRPGNFDCSHSLFLVLTKKAVDALIDAFQHFDEQGKDVACLGFPGDFVSKDYDGKFQPIDGNCINLVP